MALAVLAVDHANESLHESRVIRWIVMATARSAEIVMRGNARPNASTSMANRNLQMNAQIRKHPRGGG
jgi:hypothetical protein